MRTKLKNNLKDKPIYLPRLIFGRQNTEAIRMFRYHWINAATLGRESEMPGCFRFYGSHTFDEVADILDAIQRGIWNKQR